MTEAEWLACEDPATMLDCFDPGPVRNLLTSSGHERRLLLFCVACCRAAQHNEPDFSGSILTATERYVDGAGEAEEIIRSGHRYDSDLCPALRISQHFEFRRDRQPASVLSCAISVARLAGWSFGRGSRDQTRGGDEIERGMREQTDLLRDAFGNPFRPITFDPRWRTSTAIAIAQVMYESRDYSAMPILADALQDAGCDNDDILNHCRDANGVHVRGCWVVDLVLGKE